MLLLVEDDPDDEMLTLAALEEHRILNTCVVVRDGAAALEYLLGDDDRPRPSVVLLDIKLPKVDGLEVLRRVRAEPRLATLPIVMLTSSNEERDLVRSYRLGANSYIRKPVDFDQFAAAVRELGLYWLVLNEPPPKEARGRE